MKNFIKPLLFMMVAAIMTMFMCSCGNTPSADSKITAQQEALVSQANAQAGLPAIVNFQEKKMAKMIYELRDQENLVCYAYIVTMDAKLVFLGKCMGFGLPYSTQYSSPEKLVDADNILLSNNVSFTPMSVPQSEPNGLFMPDATSATWLLLLDSKGVPHPVYIEPTIIVSPFPLAI